MNLKQTAIIYTSDHGQAVFNGKLTHCSVADPDPREGLVPMFVLTGISDLKARFVSGAKANQAKTSHFMIRPTVLTLMGFEKGQIAGLYGPSLLEKAPARTMFTSGDIFGVFRKDVRWTEVDLNKNFKEQKQPDVTTITKLHASSKK